MIQGPWIYEAIKHPVFFFSFSQLRAAWRAAGPGHFVPSFKPCYPLCTHTGLASLVGRWMIQFAVRM